MAEMSARKNKRDSFPQVLNGNGCVDNKVDFTDDEAAAVLIGYTGAVKVFSVHLMTSIKCMYQETPQIYSKLRECWKDHFVYVVKYVGDLENTPRTWIGIPTGQDIANCVCRGYFFLQQSKTNIQCSFKVRGITTTNPRLVCNYNFFKRMMANVEVDSDGSDVIKIDSNFEKHRYFIFFSEID